MARQARFCVVPANIAMQVGPQLLRSFCLWCFKSGIKDSLNAP